MFYAIKSFAVLIAGLCLAQAAHSNEIKIVGSRTLEPFLKAWSADYQKRSPGANVLISTPGTSVAPKALLEGRAHLAAMNREMTHEEVENFVRLRGFYPTFVAVAVKAVGFYVHPQNPIKGLTYRQLEAIYAAGRGCGKAERITTWGHLGLGGEWSGQRIAYVGLDNRSPVTDFVNRAVLCRDRFKADMVALSEEAVATEVGKNKFALGYASFAPDNGLKPVAVKKGQGAFVLPSVATVRDGSYKLQHYLYLYFARPQGKRLDPNLAEFIKIGLSREGQAQVENAGYISLSEDLVKRQLGKL